MVGKICIFFHASGDKVDVAVGNGAGVIVTVDTAKKEVDGARWVANPFTETGVTGDKVSVDVCAEQAVINRTEAHSKQNKTALMADVFNLQTTIEAAQ
jgi:hypothetical protein